MANDKKVVNTSVQKIDAIAMSLGKPLYTGDLAPENALCVKMLWSPHAHAVIEFIDISKAEKMPGVKCVLCYNNVSRIPHCTAGQGYPEPSPYDTYIFDSKVRFVGDRVAAVAAETIEQAEAAVKAIIVKYKLLEPVFSQDDALKKNAPIIHDEEDSYIPIPPLEPTYRPKENIAATVAMETGNFNKAMEESDFKFDASFQTGRAQHASIENYISFSYMDSRDRLVVYTSTQVPFHCRRILSQVLEIPVKKIRVVKPRIGGGFGSKQEIMLEDIVSIFTLRTGRAVIWEFTREETFKTGRTRHPIRIRMKYGLKKEGYINALGMDLINNTGAYGGHALTVMSCSGSRVIPLYHVDNIHFDAIGVYTNSPVCGAYRGFGATQAYFAVESMIDVMAEKINIDPLEFRRSNHIKVGESHPAFEALGEGKPGTPMTIGSCALDECLDIGAKEINWSRRTPYTTKTGRYRKGLGMAMLMQGSSVPDIDMASAALKINDDGSFNLTVGATDLGTGSDTILAQIAAEVLSTTVDQFIVYSSDTDMTPFDKGAYASSTTYLSGEAVRITACKIKDQILYTASEMLNKKIEELYIENGIVKVLKSNSFVTFSDIAHETLYLNNQYQIAAYGSKVSRKSPPPFAAHFTEIEVDMKIGLIKVLKYVSTTDCGTAINPQLAEGQVEGAVLDAISCALTEDYLYDKNGSMIGPSFKEYGIYSLRDKPKMKTILVPSYESTGPFGAKSVSEIGFNGPMPAIANAVFNATGCRLYEAPFTKERVWRALNDMPRLKRFML